MGTEDKILDHCGLVNFGVGIQSYICKFSPKGYFSREMDARRGHEVSKDSEHGDAAVFVFHLPQIIESLLVSVLQNIKWVPESKGRLSAKFIGKCHRKRAANSRTCTRLEGDGTSKRG